MDLRAFSANTAGKLNILGHDCYTLSMNSTQVGIFEETNKVRLSSFLKSENSRSLETKIAFGEILSDFTHKTLERQLADEEVSRLLVTADFTECHSSRTVTVGLLNSSG